MTMSDYQGKRPDQIKNSEQLFFWSVVLFIITLVILKIIQ
jgi:hypothetical protein